ncbi:DUF4173 domain-containing protein [Paenibacillus sp. CGMCC 1.16610]|uniref:DUF4173 domain-containing protein n=1 Tax=Paenibacillus anseongense TaxID=2682845 RepID=A0ABW9UN82_9BACL|nr:MULTISPECIES: DUF4173 domain-containing protein [Paenibacillus]MBA2941181.1 DUF4173 domain-containing protein [Paenibacillus sp. CGMCC 1.16610]MVQ40000.1 DUF4173 domain-containing protein [Paenibacillus anseongense]
MRDPAPWQRKYSYMLAYACLFGLLVQYLFIGRPAGISVFLSVAGFYGLYFYSIKGRLGGFEPWKGQSTAGWLLMVPVGLLALTYGLFANNFFHLLNMIALPLCIVMQTVVLSRNSKHAWYHATFLQDMVRHVISSPITYLPVPFGMLKAWLPGGGNRKDSTWGKVVKVLAGLLLAAPILFIVIGLLASADQIFFSWIAEIPTWFSGVSIGESVGRIVLAVVITLYTFCYMWGLLFPKVIEASHPFDSQKDETAAATEVIIRSKAQLDPITAGTLLICVNVVYVLFAIIQFSYLFGAADGLLPSGVAYAEYARRGFSELVVVALINVSLLFPGLHWIRSSSPLGEKIRKLLLTLLVTCTIVMLISAYGRLSLYEEAYGFTQTRLLVHGFMIFLGILFVLAFFRIWIEKMSMSRAYITTAILAYLVMNYMNLDHRIAINNMERYEKTGVIDLEYLGRLSTDVVPALKELKVKHPELSSVQQTIDRVMSDQKNKTWPSWNLSSYRANR